MEKKIIVGAVIIIFAIALVFFISKANEPYDQNNLNAIKGPSNFYRCFDVSNKVSYEGNALIFENDNCTFTERSIEPNLTFSTETEGSINIKSKLVLNESCEKISEKMTGFEIINLETDGLYFGSDYNTYYCSETEYRV